MTIGLGLRLAWENHGLDSESIFGLIGEGWEKLMIPLKFQKWMDRGPFSELRNLGKEQDGGRGQ